jgi:hypothetical protein
MQEMLFHTPWWLPTLIAGVGVVVFITGNRRTESRVRTAGLGIILLAILLAAVSYFVDTPLETAERRSNELVKAFEKADWPKMTSILDRSAVVKVLDRNIYTSRDDIIEAAKKAHQKYGFKSANVLSSSATQADTVITVNLTLLTEQDALGRTLNSRWEFEWQNTADGWMLVEVRAVQIGNVTGTDMRNMFP